jgi:hypothetical protein
MAWIDGSNASVVGLRYDGANAPTYAGTETTLNYRPYFAYGIQTSQYGPSSMHLSGVFHLWADGAVEVISTKIAGLVYTAAVTRRGGEVVDVRF